MNSRLSLIPLLFKRPVGVNPKNREKIQHANFSNQHVESCEATLQNTSSVSEEIDKKFKKSSFELQWEYFERTIFSLLFKTFISSIFGPFTQLADWSFAQILYNFVGMY